ncbi:MAG: hypothetical protein WCS42_02125 [Verrucomicrobiota bacterium]
MAGIKREFLSHLGQSLVPKISNAIYPAKARFLEPVDFSVVFAIHALGITQAEIGLLEE